ncbi:hypothetical protein FV218_11660, partial [Methylobacterium sp. WL69]
GRPGAGRGPIRLRGRPGGGGLGRRPAGGHRMGAGRPLGRGVAGRVPARAPGLGRGGVAALHPRLRPPALRHPGRARRLIRHARRQPSAVMAPAHAIVSARADGSGGSPGVLKGPSGAAGGGTGTDPWATAFGTGSESARLCPFHGPDPADTGEKTVPGGRASWGPHP